MVDNFIRGRKENLAWAISNAKCLQMINNTIEDPCLVNSITEGIDYVFHEAALRLTYCEQKPHEALSVMANGTYNVLQAASKFKVKRLLYASSASVYSNVGYGDEMNEEKTPVGANTIYGVYKYLGELLCEHFTIRDNLSWITTRGFNFYGPRMDAYGAYTEVLIRWLYNIRKGEDIVIYGDGSDMIDFIYIDDIIRMKFIALESCMQGVFNLGSSNPISLKDLAILLKEATNSSVNIVYKEKADKTKLASYRKAYMGKTKACLGFETCVDIKQGLAKLVEWFNKEVK
jgi:UDP-glucose 4-epimerase